MQTYVLGCIYAYYSMHMIVVCFCYIQISSNRIGSHSISFQFINLPEVTSYDEGNGGGAWVVRNPESTVWDLVNELELWVSAPRDDAVKWRWLNKSEVHEVWEDAASINEEMRLESSLAASPKYITFLPNRGVADFQHK